MARTAVGGPDATAAAPALRAAAPGTIGSAPGVEQGEPAVRGYPGEAFTDQSYPAAVIRANERGRVVARLRVDETGTPDACRILTSSESTSLDGATCRVALDRVRLDPARDRRGAAKVSYYTLPVSWRAPD